MCPSLSARTYCNSDSEVGRKYWIMAEFNGKVYVRMKEGKRIFLFMYVDALKSFTLKCIIHLFNLYLKDWYGIYCHIQWHEYTSIIKPQNKWNAEEIHIYKQHIIVKSN